MDSVLWNTLDRTMLAFSLGWPWLLPKAFVQGYDACTYLKQLEMHEQSNINVLFASLTK